MEDDESTLLQSANMLDEAAHDLACGTRAINRPYDSYVLLGRLTAAQRLLAQVFEQLADWHSRVVDGAHYNGEDGFAVGLAPGVIRAELALRDAADLAGQVEDSLMLAHSANGVVRWFDEDNFEVPSGSSE